jgi:hypothetical protein
LLLAAAGGAGPARGQQALAWRSAPHQHQHTSTPAHQHTSAPAPSPAPQDAQKIEDGQLVVEFREASPKQLAEERGEQQVAALNQRLGDDIARLDSWRVAQQLLLQHGEQLNYLNASMLCYKLSLLRPALEDPGAAGASPSTEAEAAGQQEQHEQQREFSALVSQLSQLVLRRMSWYRSRQFEQTAAGLSACGLQEPAFWHAFVREMDPRLSSFSAGQLANVLASLAAAGYVPSRNWLERTERQAGKHLHRASAGGRLACRCCCSCCCPCCLPLPLTLPLTLLLPTTTPPPPGCAT